MLCGYYLHLEISTRDEGRNPATSTGPNPDFEALVSEPLVFLPGVTEKTFPIKIFDDSGIIDYSDEHFIVALDGLAEVVEAEVTIVNDDGKILVFLTQRVKTQYLQNIKHNRYAHLMSIHLQKGCMYI